LEMRTPKNPLSDGKIQGRAGAGSIWKEIKKGSLTLFSGKCTFWREDGSHNQGVLDQNARGHMGQPQTKGGGQFPVIDAHIGGQHECWEERKEKVSGGEATGILKNPTVAQIVSIQNKKKNQSNRGAKG